ncbi:MAG: ABC transporter permease [Alphaproteobacteria bacterium]|nr:ABC transporter permease [Alphaproteobacteria bacterium]
MTSRLTPLRAAFLLGLPILALVALFVIPIGNLLLRSVLVPGLSLAKYEQVLASDTNLYVMWLTVEIGASVTAATAIVGYPIAYYLATRRNLLTRLLMLFVVVPYFTSSLVRTYAWMVLLGNEGIINTGLRSLALVEGSLPLMYNRFGVLVGMTYVLLPYMILTLYAVLRGIDFRLAQAAESLGATARQAFLYVVLPLSMPGVAGGALLVFIVALGFFITPALMGGDRDMMIAQVIDLQIETNFDWAMAAAVSVVLLAVVLALFVVYERALGFSRLLESKA